MTPHVRRDLHATTDVVLLKLSQTALRKRTDAGHVVVHVQRRRKHLHARRLEFGDKLAEDRVRVLDWHLAQPPLHRVVESTSEKRKRVDLPGKDRPVIAFPGRPLHRKVGLAGRERIDMCAEARRRARARPLDGQHVDARYARTLRALHHELRVFARPGYDKELGNHSVTSSLL